MLCRPADWIQYSLLLGVLWPTDGLCPHLLLPKHILPRVQVRLSDKPSPSRDSQEILDMLYSLAPCENQKSSWQCHWPMADFFDPVVISFTLHCRHIPKKHPVQTMALAYWSFHYAKRIFETFVVHRCDCITTSARCINCIMSLPQTFHALPVRPHASYFEHLKLTAYAFIFVQRVIVCAISMSSFTESAVCFQHDWPAAGSAMAPCH